MIGIVRKILDWFGVGATPAAVPTARLRLRITRALLTALHEVTVPTRPRSEPLAFLRVRFASEESKDVVVAVGVVGFPERAYVDGPAGANFDTRWSIMCANEAARSNAGLLLAHHHGGKGKPCFSSVDRKTNLAVMAPLSYGASTLPYGAVVLSEDDATAVIAFGGELLDTAVELVPDGLGGFTATA